MHQKQHECEAQPDISKACENKPVKESATENVEILSNFNRCVTDESYSPRCSPPPHPSRRKPKKKLLQERWISDQKKAMEQESSQEEISLIPDEKIVEVEQNQEEIKIAPLSSPSRQFNHSKQPFPLSVLDSPVLPESSMPEFDTSVLNSPILPEASIPESSLPEDDFWNDWQKPTSTEKESEPNNALEKPNKKKLRLHIMIPLNLRIPKTPESKIPQKKS